jgi:hypothetical protein
MKITLTDLNAMIVDELRHQLNTKDRKQRKKKAKLKNNLVEVPPDDSEESDTERKRRIFGHEELDQLSKGIIPEEQIEEFNTSHSSDGKFSSHKDSTCDSSYFVNKKRSRKRGKLTDPDESGRGPTKTGQGQRICKSDKLKFAEGSEVKELEFSELQKMIADVAEEALKK